jgi:hypothetical protein
MMSMAVMAVTVMPATVLAFGRSRGRREGQRDGAERGDRRDSEYELAIHCGAPVFVDALFDILSMSVACRIREVHRVRHGIGGRAAFDKRSIRRSWLHSGAVQAARRRNRLRTLLLGGPPAISRRIQRIIAMRVVGSRPEDQDLWRSSVPFRSSNPMRPAAI